ncbi:hypothetical protein CALCODRAFT_502174 [Calocera cornea HHB12733]|uniref:Secreted protein n=1 Tax=Calocera cornea HHB12733 TaxID=1353952 RepID=A0A165DD30_9BASI|nr:hypothetical protein CALCODRAFT_502174 [Calocera cornea HHB12733]
MECCVALLLHPLFHASLAFGGPGRRLPSQWRLAGLSSLLIHPAFHPCVRDARPLTCLASLVSLSVNAWSGSQRRLVSLHERWTSSSHSLAVYIVDGDP